MNAQRNVAFPMRIKLAIPFFVAALATTVYVGSSRAFFPSPPPPGGPGGGGNENRNVPERGAGPPGGESPPGGDTGHFGEIPGLPPNFGPHTPPGGEAIPELDPGSIAGGLGLLIAGTLILTDRRRRK
jgi:hypothetical protein